MKTRAQLSMGAILAALQPPERKQPEYVGWFVPNNGALTKTLQNVAKAGKRIGVTVLDIGTVKFFAEDPEVPTYEYACSSCADRTLDLRRIEDRAKGPPCSKGHGPMKLVISPVAGVVKNPAVPKGNINASR